jgi:hypothetical protein
MFFTSLLLFTLLFMLLSTLLMLTKTNERCQYLCCWCCVCCCFHMTERYDRDRLLLSIDRCCLSLLSIDHCCLLLMSIVVVYWLLLSINRCCLFIIVDYQLLLSIIRSCLSIVVVVDRCCCLCCWCWLCWRCCCCIHCCCEWCFLAGPTFHKTSSLCCVVTYWWIVGPAKIHDFHVDYCFRQDLHFIKTLWSEGKSQFRKILVVLTTTTVLYICLLEIKLLQLMR